MNHQGKNILVGVFVIAAIVLVVFLVLFLHPSVGDESHTLRVRFANIEKIQLGSRVTFAGRPVGQVIEIREIRDARRQPADLEGDLYFWEVTLALDSGVRVYDTDEITVYTPGFFGDRGIAIIPKQAPPGVVSHLVGEDQVVYAQSTDQMQDTFNELGNVATRINTAFQQISQLIEDNSEEIHDALIAFRDAMVSVDGTFSDVNQEQLIATLKDAFDTVGSAMHDIGSLTRTLEEEGFAENISDAAGSFNTLATRISNGHGTLGRLLNDEALYLRTMSLMGKADTMLSDINHYGLLFHLKRGWQRQRTQRIEALASLRTTADYQNYFQREVSHIQMSLDRVSMLLDKARCECPNAPLLNNRQFVCEFVQLMQEVEQLRKRLACYNEQLCSCGR